jgi:hypothetical protein
MDENGRALIDAALPLLLDRAGGEIEYTQSEYQAIRARRGPYRISAEVDKSGPGEPVIRVRLVPSDVRDDTPVS